MGDGGRWALGWENHQGGYWEVASMSRGEASSPGVIVLCVAGEDEDDRLRGVGV